MSVDLSADALEGALAGRPLRAYPALVSTEAAALAWARSGAPSGAVVVADYQASPRGRSGLALQAAPGRGLGFSLILRPRLAAAREGWMYVAATAALADSSGADATIAWPDQVRSAGGTTWVGVHGEPGRVGLEWVVVTVLMSNASPPRGGLLAHAVDAIEAMAGAPHTEVLSEYLPRCETLGRAVRVSLLPLGAAGAGITGRAVTVLKDGALLLETPEGRRIAVRPHALGQLEGV